MWTVIWTVAVFVLLLFHGDAILAFAAEQLHQRRAHRLRLEQERTRQALISHDRDALVWRQLDGAADTATKPPSASEPAISSRIAASGRSQSTGCGGAGGGLRPSAPPHAVTESLDEP
jgi:hypothetical protein